MQRLNLLRNIIALPTQSLQDCTLFMNFKTKRKAAKVVLPIVWLSVIGFIMLLIVRKAAAKLVVTTIFHGTKTSIKVTSTIAVNPFQTKYLSNKTKAPMLKTLPLTLL